jgi:hypothetical protein
MPLGTSTSSWRVYQFHQGRKLPCFLHHTGCRFFCQVHCGLFVTAGFQGNKDPVHLDEGALSE